MRTKDPEPVVSLAKVRQARDILEDVRNVIHPYALLDDTHEQTIQSVYEDLCAAIRDDYDHLMQVWPPEAIVRLRKLRKRLDTVQASYVARDVLADVNRASELLLPARAPGAESPMDFLTRSRS